MRVAGEEDAGAGGLVVDEQDLGGVGEDVAELADDAVGGDDGLIGLEAVVGALVDVEDAGEVGAAGADDLGGDGGGDVVLLEVEQRLEAVALEGVLGDGGLLEAELGELLLESRGSAGGRGGGRCSWTSRSAVSWPKPWKKRSNGVTVETAQ